MKIRHRQISAGKQHGHKNCSVPDQTLKRYDSKTVIIIFAHLEKIIKYRRQQQSHRGMICQDQDPAV